MTRQIALGARRLNPQGRGRGFLSDGRNHKVHLIPLFQRVAAREGDGVDYFEGSL